MNDNLPPLPPYAPEFKPRWPTDPGGYNEEQMQAYARATIERQSVPAGWYITKAEAMADAEEQAIGAAAPQPQPVQGPVAWQSIESMAAERYKVVPSHESMFYRYAVVAGNGTQQLYLGRETECENMARKFAGAFLDGAHVVRYLNNTSPQAQPLSDDLINDLARTMVKEKKSVNWLAYAIEAAITKGTT